MIPLFVGLLTFLSAFLRSRCSLGLEILALRQQLCVLKRKRPRPRLRTQDRMFWILLRWLWPAWSNVLVVVRPETVVAWHRAGFRLFWRLKSRTKDHGRPKIDCEIRSLIQKMLEEIPRGALREFTVSFSSLASRSRNVLSLAVSGACLLVTRPPSYGQLSLAITAM